MRDPQDKKPFAQALGALAAVYRVELTRPLLLGYWLALQDLELDEVRAAIVEALKNGGKFMPVPSDLRPKRKAEFAATYHRPWIEPAHWRQGQLEGGRREEWPALEGARTAFPRLLEALKPEGDPS